MRRYELEDEHWELIGGCFPKESRGRPWRDHRTIVNGIMWILFSGAPWRDLPERYGSWKMAHRRFTRWRRDGTWEKVLARLQLRADQKGLLDYAQWNIDSTRFARPSPRQGRKKGVDIDEPPDHALGLSRGRRGTKVHLATEKRGLPLAFVLTTGEAHEAPVFPSLMEIAREARPRLGLPDRLAGDKGYASKQIRDWLAQRRIEALIPPKSNQDAPVLWISNQRKKYRGRNVVERCVGRLKEFRRIATRYEKLALNFAGMVTLAMIVIYLKAL